MNKIDINKYLEDNNYNLESNDSDGLKINLDNELLIKGTKNDLIELSEYILNIALSDNEKDHIHLDELSLISDESNIKELIIEKEKIKQINICFLYVIIK